MTSESGPASLTALGIRQVDGSRVALAGPDYADIIYSIPTRQSQLTEVRALLLDLDGTSLSSEDFWVSVLEETLRSVSGTRLSLGSDDRTLLQGSTTRSHLDHLVHRYQLDITLSDIVRVYESKVSEMFFDRAINDLAVELPLRSGFAELRQEASRRGIPFILVTNGNERKAQVEAAIIGHHLSVVAPSEVANGVWCAPRSGGWLRAFGSGAGKPHPWPYLEAATKGAGVQVADLASVVAVDDSAAGVCSIRLAGLTTIGLTGGNIEHLGAEFFCDHIVGSLHELLGMIQ